MALSSFALGGPQALSGRRAAAPQALRPSPLLVAASRRRQFGLRVRAQAAKQPELFPAQVCVVLGTQWGDEGKGKLVDILAQQYDIVARAQVRAGGALTEAGPPRRRESWPG